MYKKEFSHLISFHIDIPIEQFDNLVEAIELYNHQNGTEIENNFIRIFYNNKHFELKHKSFGGRGKRLSFNKAKSLLLSNEAILYLGNETMMVKQKCVVKNKVISLFADDMFYKTAQPFKDINTLNYEISTIIAFTEYFDGDLVYTGELNGSDNILISYKTGEELHNIENKCPLCENIYAEYKIDIIYGKKGFDMIFTSFVETNERTLLANDKFLEGILQTMNQFGGDIIVYENTEINKVSLILHDKSLSDLIYNNIDLEHIKSYEEETRKYKDLINEYEEESFVKYFDIGFEALHNNHLENYFNIQNVYQRLDKKDFVANVKQSEEDIIINLYAPKHAYIPKESIY